MILNVQNEQTSSDMFQRIMPKHGVYNANCQQNQRKSFRNKRCRYNQ